MPELPEVETVRQGLLPHLAGERIRFVKVFSRNLRQPIPDNFEERLQGTRIATINRRAKYLLFDLYIVWPGQALAYKIGELKIKELKALAKEELGEAFDIRAFHDQVLGNGALPLRVLETHIKEWVAEQKGGDGEMEGSS